MNKFTDKEVQLLEKFFYIYFMGMAIEKNIISRTEHEEMIEEHKEEVTDLVAMFKASKFPNQEIEERALIEFTLTICLQTFSPRTIKNINHLLKENFLNM